VNLPTFEREDFLLDRELSPRLSSPKVERLGEVRMGLARGQVIFIDLALRNVLASLDSPRPASHSAGEVGEYLFHLPSGAETVTLFAPPRAVAGARLFVRRSVRGEGIERGSAFADHAVRRLPFVVHPSEIQIVRIAHGGAATFHVYDREETCAPGFADGAGPLWTTSYCFLRFGERCRRELWLRVRALRVIPRARVERRKMGREHRGEALRRWFGLDLGEEGIWG